MPESGARFGLDLFHAEFVSEEVFGKERTERGFECVDTYTCHSTLLTPLPYPSDDRSVGLPPSEWV